MQLWLNDPHSVDKLMDMKRLEKKGEGRATQPAAVRATLGWAHLGLGFVERCDVVVVLFSLVCAALCTQSEAFGPKVRSDACTVCFYFHYNRKSL